MHVLRGEKKRSQRDKQLKLKSTSKSGAFLNPNSVLIIALSTVVNYIKRCDFMRARSIDNFFLAMTNTRHAYFSAPPQNRNYVLILAALSHYKLASLKVLA